MTHVAHPYIQRIGINRSWRSRWFAAGPLLFREYLRTDDAIRFFLEKKLKGMSVASLEIERKDKLLRIVIATSRPGLVIGRSGEGAIQLKKEINLLLRTLKLTEKPEIKIDIEEIRTPEASAAIVGQMIAEGLEKRMPFRRVLRQTVEKVIANRDVEGVRIIIAGRLGGADMARRQEVKKGRVPLQTLRSDIDFSRYRAILPYGTIGIKVWIYTGEVFSDRAETTQIGETAAPRRGNNRSDNRART